MRDGWERTPRQRNLSALSNDLSVGKLVILLNRRATLSSLQFLLVVQGNISKIFFHVTDHFPFSSGGDKSVAYKTIIPLVTQSVTKQSKLTEIIDLQIDLEHYDPKKVKHFDGSMKQSPIPRHNMKICLLRDARHREEKKSIVSLASEFVIEQIFVFWELFRKVQLSVFALKQYGNDP